MQQEALSPYEKAVQQQEEANKAVGKLIEDVSKLTQGLATLAGLQQSAEHRYVLSRYVQNFDLLVQQPLFCLQFQALH